MTSLSDTLTVGLVLVLLFGSIVLYLYTRIQQAEQKISLLESILLDLKMSTEIKSYTDLPAATRSMDHKGINYAPFDEDDSDNYYPNATIDVTSTTRKGSRTPSISSKCDEDDIEESDISEVAQYKSIIAEAVDKDQILTSISKVSSNYEVMTLKELQTLAKSRGITGASSMKKGAIIEALKTSDRSSTIEPGSSTMGSTASTSFLETSSPFGADETQ